MTSRSSEVVVITGASAGVGRATVREFARRGARIGLIARDEERLRATAREVEALGGAALALPLDVADAQCVENAAEEVERSFGAIDIWVNNAMVTVFSPVAELEPGELKRVTEVTYLGSAYGTMAALRRMRRRGRGTIAQVGSALVYRSIPLQAAYCAAKHAIQGFLESLRSELLHEQSRIHITIVQLPALNTPQFEWLRTRLPRKAQPVPPIFQPEVAAKAIYWAAHERRRQVLVGGSTVQAIWGEKLAPGLLDRYLAATAYGAQMTNEPEESGRPGNLFQPVAGEFAAHGRFDARARRSSWQLFWTMHRTAVLAVTAGLCAALAGPLAWHKRREV